MLEKHSMMVESFESELIAKKSKSKLSFKAFFMRIGRNRARVLRDACNG